MPEPAEPLEPARLADLAATRRAHAWCTRPTHGVACMVMGAAVLATVALDVAGLREIARNVNPLLPVAWLLLLRASRGCRERHAADAAPGEGVGLRGWQIAFVYAWAVSHLLVLVARGASSALDLRPAGAPGPLLLRDVLVVSGVVATPLLLGWSARTGKDALLTVVLSGLALMSTVLPAHGRGPTVDLGRAEVALHGVYVAALAVLGLVITAEGVREKLRYRALERRLQALQGADGEAPPGVAA